jgi:hypothetical protein
MLRATDRFLSAWTNLPDLEKTAMQASSSPGVRVFFQPTIGWRQTDTPPKPVRPSVTGWGALNGSPNCHDPAYRHKNGFPFPPEVILGGFSFLVTSLHEIARSAVGKEGMSWLVWGVPRLMVMEATARSKLCALTNAFGSQRRRR